MNANSVLDYGYAAGQDGPALFAPGAEVVQSRSSLEPLVEKYDLYKSERLRGEPIEVRGCDLFEFAGGKVSRKDSFWKIVE